MARQIKSSGAVLLLSLLVLLASTTASPQCRSGCQGLPSVYQLNYETGHTYVYNFEGHTLASLPGQQGDGTKLNLKATAEVSLLDNCKGVLKLKGVQITGPDSQKFSHLSDLEAHPVSFGFENGVVDRELCTEEGDSEASVNIKRAVLSLFQVAPTESAKGGHNKVLDVFGICPTDFSSSGRGETTTITKTRNLNRCHLREHLQQDFASVPYHVESDFQATPLLQATQEVRQQLKGGVLNSAESHEKYLYRPYSNQDVGATTAVDSKLTLVSHSKKAAPALTGSTPRSLVFEPPHIGNTGSSNVAAIVEALHKAHATMPEYVGETAAREFANVVSILRHSSKDDLLSVYGQVKAGAGFKEKSAGTKLFLDALFRAGTGEAVEVAVELLKSKKITGPHADLYYLQFAFTKHVSLAALKAAATLLDEPEVSKLAYLGVGALGGRYCAKHRCDGVPEFDSFLQKLAAPISNGCKSSSWEEEVKIVAALKALTNVHHLNDAIADKLRVCALDNNLPTRVRVAALDTFQSDACRLKQTSLEVLKNQQLDSELRIKAFLALVECPCNKMANPLKEVLDSEPTNQVGSFIVSYLRNLRTSTNPSKKQIKDVYGQIRTTKRFPIDIRKFSNNFEVSYLVDGLNLGSTLESNIIYSQRSFLPRATTLNVTTEMFGHSVNFFEVEFRQENLDLIAERLFGPKGYFNTHSAVELVKEGKDRITDFENTVKQRLNNAIRGKRSVTKEDLEGVRQKTVPPYHADPDRELLLEFSTKLFGSEVGWLTFHHNAKDAAKKTLDNSFDIIDKIVKKAKDFDYKLRQHNTFLDSELVYPTSLGFALKLTASGSSAVHVELEGKLDANELINNFKNSHVHFKLVPSAAVEVVGSFVVDAYAVEAGMKIATTLHTATGVDINIKATDGLGVDVTLGLPVKKQDVITVKSEVLTTVQELGKSEVDTPINFASTPRRDYQGCFDQLSPLIGLTFCSTVSFPWDPVTTKAAFYPLNGPSKFSLTVESADVSSYHFHASLNNKDPHKKSLELLLETPNSQTERKLGLILVRTLEPYQGIKAELSSPWKHLSVELAFTDSDKELSLLAKLLNDAQEYSVKIGASVTGDPSHATYHPLLEYKTPEQKGSLISHKGSKGKPEKLSQSYHVDGSITVDKTSDSRKFTFNDVIFTSPQGQYVINGNVGSQGQGTYYTDLKVVYGEHHAVFKSEFKKLSPSEFHLNVLLQPSQHPDFGVNLVWDYKRDKYNLENTLTVVHGRDPGNNEARFSLHQQAHYKFDNIQNFDFSTKNEVSYPLLNIVGKFEGAVTPKSFHLDTEASYEKHKFELELTAKTGIHKPGDYDVEFNAKVLDNGIEFETKREIISPDKSKFTTELEVKPGGKYDLVAEVTHVFERNNINFQVDALAKVHGQPNEYKLDSGLVLNQNVFDSHYKATLGTEDYIDIIVKYTRGSGHPSGNVKVLLKNYINGNGQFKYEAGKGNADLSIDIPKIGRKIKGTGELEVSGSLHVANVDIFYNADKNPDHKIHFHTKSDLKKEAIDSKNTLVILDYKTEFNVKGQLTGKIEDGQLKGDFDLTLPTGHHFTGKLDRTLHVRSSNSEADVNLELTAQTSPSSEPAKVTLEFAAKNVDTKHYSFDGQSKLAYHSSSGKDVAVIIAAKNIPQREQRVVEAQVVLQGSLVGEPLRVEFNSEIYEPYVTYKGHGSYGNGAIVDISGKVSKTLKWHENYYEGPFSVENLVELKLPIEKVKHIKIVSTLSGKLEEKKLEFKYDEELDLDEKTYKLSLETHNEIEKGNNKLVLILPGHEPKTYTSNWYFNYDDFKTKDVVKGGFSWAGNQDSKLSVDIDGKKDWSDFYAHGSLQTPLEKLKNAEFTLKNKFVPYPKYQLDTDLALTVDDKKFTIVNQLTPGVFESLPNIDFTSTHPEGKSRVYLFLQSKGSHDISGKTELEWATNGGGKLIASGKANYESAQNFKAELDVDSAALKLNKWHVVLANKAVKGKPFLQLTATEAGTSVINGRLEYHVENTENLYKAGVSGTVKVRDQSQPLKAEISYAKFTLAEHGELGAEGSIEFSLGQRSFEASSKYTNKEYKTHISLCAKSGLCSVAEAHSLIKSIDLTHLEHIFGAKVDLKATHLPEGFVLEGKTVRQPSSFDHQVELKLLNAKQTTYKLHSYLNDKTVGVVATLPQRIIAAEGKVGYSKEKGERKLDLNFWLNKEKQPENKAGLHLLYVFNPSTDGTIIQGDAKFSHPALAKDFAITSKAVLLQHDTLLDATIDLDVFAKKNQKIIVSAKYVRHQVAQGFNVTGYITAKGRILDVYYEEGLELSTHGISYSSVLTYKNQKQKTKDAQVIFRVTDSEVFVYVKSPSAELLRIERHYNKLPNDQLAIRGEVYALGQEPVEVEGLIDFPRSRKDIIYKRNTPNRKLEIELLHDLLVGFGVHITSVVDGKRKDVLYVAVDLTDNNFLKTHFTWSTDDIKRLMELVKHDVEAFVKQAKIASDDFGNEVTSELQDLLEAIKKAQPDTKAIISSYKDQLKDLKEELENDEGFTEASENVKKFIHAFTKAIVETSKKIAELADHTLEIIVRVRIAVQESVNKLLPKVKQFTSKAVDLATAVSSAALETGSKVLLKLADFVKQHEEELQEFAKIVQDFIEDIGKVVGQTIVQIRSEVLGFVRILTEHVKTLPIYENFKEYYQHLVAQLSENLVPEQAMGVIKEVLGSLKDSLPTKELKELVSAVEAYIEKQVNKQPVNHEEELQTILNKALKAFTSLLNFLRSHLPQQDSASSASFLGLRLPFGLNALYEFPKTLAIKFSPFFFLTSDDVQELPTVQEILHTYKPSLNPLDWIPPYRAHGIVIDLYHFVTFDGRHFTFKGTCSYVLLQDVVDGNFSVAADYGAKLLIVSDNHDTLEFSHDTTFKANGQAAEYPYATTDIAVWKDFGYVNVQYKAGLLIKCQTQYNFCIFYVSGFYFGKTRGLLGTLDYEPWDDFKEPNGQVVTKVNDFGNSWKVQPSCADVSGATHHDHHMPEPAECATIFGGSTPLRLAYLFTPSAPYREACIHIVADATTPEAKKQAACKIAAAYVTSARSQYIPVSLPTECVHCPVVSGPAVEAGDIVSVKVPQKVAHVLIVVEQVTTNSELFKDLITPLVTTLGNELKGKGFTDVHFSLIGFGENTHYYPALYTSGGKITFEGKTRNIKFTDYVDSFNLKLDSCENRFKYFKALVESELGLSPASRAYQFGSQYPFKIGSSKVLVGVVGNPKITPFTVSLQQLQALYSTKVLRDRGVEFHLVVPVEELQLANKDAKNVKQIVGFDSEHVYVLSDSKKKVLEGNAELHDALSFKNNLWIPIALESHGVTYVAQNFIDSKASGRKQFLQVFSHRIAQSLETELTQDCTCKLVEGIQPFAECKVTSRKEREFTAPIKKGSGIKG